MPLLTYTYINDLYTKAGWAGINASAKDVYNTLNKNPDSSQNQARLKILQDAATQGKTGNDVVRYPNYLDEKFRGEEYDKFKAGPEQGGTADRDYFDARSQQGTSVDSTRRQLRDKEKDGLSNEERALQDMLDKNISGTKSSDNRWDRFKEHGLPGIVSTAAIAAAPMAAAIAGPAAAATAGSAGMSAADLAREAAMYGPMSSGSGAATGAAAAGAAASGAGPGATAGQAAADLAREAAMYGPIAQPSAMGTALGGETANLAREAAMYGGGGTGAVAPGATGASIPGGGLGAEGWQNFYGLDAWGGATEGSSALDWVSAGLGTAGILGSLFGNNSGTHDVSGETVVTNETDVTKEPAPWEPWMETAWDDYVDQLAYTQDPNNMKGLTIKGKAYQMPKKHDMELLRILQGTHLGGQGMRYGLPSTHSVSTNTTASNAELPSNETSLGDQLNEYRQWAEMIIKLFGG